MSSYVALKGWIECAEEDIPKIKDYINSFWDGNVWNSQEKKSLDLYKNGWVFPQVNINWSSYIFFGACVKSYFVDFFKKNIDGIISLNLEISGFFELEFYDEDKTIEWRIEDNILSEFVKE